MNRKDGGRGLISAYDCVKKEELGLFGYVKASDECNVEDCWRDVAGGRNEERVQKAGAESKDGDVSGEEVEWQVYEGC